MSFELQTQKGTLFPVAFTLALIGGICVYFALPFEPEKWVGMGVLVSGLFWFLSRKSIWGFFLIGLLFWFCLGFSVVTFKTDYLHTPQLNQPIFNAPFTGEIKEVRSGDDGQKIILQHIQSASFPYPLRLVRLNVPDSNIIFNPGDQITGKAHFIPPALPAQKGAYFFRRQAYFEGLSAVGKLIQIQDQKQVPSAVSRVDRIRNFITQRVRQTLPDNTSGVAVSLIIGAQGFVTEQVYHLYKLAGITHTLSVSGFHLAMIAGFVFLLIRGLFSFLPLLGIYFPVKKMAALLSFLIITGYFLISGRELPTVRSYMMISIILGAVLCDRQVISLRSVALACMGILLLFPESVLSVSFQLSFMAVLGLVCLYTELSQRFFKRKDRSILGKIFIAIILVGLVSFCATAVTFPFVIHHFNQIGTYSMLGNIATEFLFSFLIMPALLFAVLTMPFGWDTFFLKAAGLGLDWVEKLCAFILKLPYNYITLPDFPVSSLWVCFAGLMILMLGKKWVRFLGLILIAVSFTGFFWYQKPDLLIASDVVAIRAADGTLLLSENQKHQFITNTWLLKNGQDPFFENMPETFRGLSFKKDSVKVAFSSLDCQNAKATFIVLEKQQRGSCPPPVIDKKQLRQKGTHTVFLKKGQIKIENMVDQLGKRPWVPYQNMAK